MTGHRNYVISYLCWFLEDSLSFGSPILVLSSGIDTISLLSVTANSDNVVHHQKQFRGSYNAYSVRVQIIEMEWKSLTFVSLSTAFSRSLWLPFPHPWPFAIPCDRCQVPRAGSFCNPWRVDRSDPGPTCTPNTSLAPSPSLE
jgi:hypothetical protein